MRAPRSCASPISASSSSAVARASGSARWHGRSAVPRNHASWPRPKPATRPARSLRASRTVSTTGEPMREPVSRSVSRSRNARSKRALCATSTASPANARKLRTASAGRRRAPQVLVPQSGHRARSGGDRLPWIDERLELGLDLEPAQAHCPDLADPGLAGTQSRRLEVDYDVRRVLEQDRRPQRLGERDRVSAPREPGIGLDDVREQRAREGDGCLPQGEEPPRRVLREHRPALLLHELHQAVGRV